MAELVLPSSVDFSKRLPALPDGVSSQLMSLQATNGTGPFTPGQVIQFDLPSQKDLYLDGSTMFIRYKISYTSGATKGEVRRKPVYTAFQKLDEFIGSQPINSVYNYHTAANLWVDTNMSVADIYGQQTAFGINSAAAIPTLNEFDGFICPTASVVNSLFLAAPVVCSAIQSADHLWPTGLMPPLRVQFTVASIADQATVAANITTIEISNPELCIQSINMPGVDAIVASSSPKLYVKCDGWAVANQSLASGSAGFQSLVFNHRFESIKNLFLVNSSTAVAVGVNGPLESYDITSGNGTYQFQIGQSLYPLQPINTAIGGGRGSVLQYLRECVGSITDQRNSMSINSVEYGRIASTPTVSTLTEPAKFYVSVPLQKLSSRSPYQAITLLSGVSAASTPINVLVNIGTATGTNINSQLVANYDLLAEIDPMSRTVMVIQ